MARNIALACCSCTRSHCIALIAFALLCVRNTLDSIALGLQRFGLLRVGIATDVDGIARISVPWIASRLRLHRLELHRLELRCLKRTAVALVCIAGWAANRCILHRLDCNAWIAWLGLHLDWDCIARNCIAWTCVALNVLQLHLFAWQSRNGCRCWANQSLRNHVCSCSIGGALGMVGLLGLRSYGVKSELVM